jgi:hypothetical protein
LEYSRHLDFELRVKIIRPALPFGIGIPCAAVTASHFGQVSQTVSKRKGGNMESTIRFNLRNDQRTEVNINVWDDRTSRQLLDTVALNRGESVSVEVVVDSLGKGAAHWTFASIDGSVKSNKCLYGINDGDECTLG